MLSLLAVLGSLGARGGPLVLQDDNDTDASALAL